MNVPAPQATLSAEDLFGFWQRAMPVAQAYYQLDRTEASEKYRSYLPRTNALNLIANTIAEATGKGDAVDAGLRITSSELSEFQKLGDGLRSVLVARILSDELTLAGFVFPRAIDDGPRCVPKDLVRGISWDNGRVQGQGLRIDDVRVFPTEWISRRLRAREEHTVAIEAPKQGRPSKRDLISGAFEACVRIGSITAGTSARHAASQIREWIVKHRPEEFEDGKGLKNEAVRNVIGDRLRELKGDVSGKE